MNTIISAAFSRSRVVIMSFVIILAIGAFSYIQIPKEAYPEVPMPQVYVSTSLDGISPDDAERLLLEPMETEFSALEGLKDIKGEATEGFASVQLEFAAGGDIEETLTKVREAVDRVEGELPDDATDLQVTEINSALFPIITGIISGPVPERTLNDLAENLKERAEALPGVLEVEIHGARDEFVEVLLDPTVIQTYELRFEQIVSLIQRNNSLIAAGAIESGGGRLVLKVPGLIDNVEDLLAMPLKVRGETVVSLGEVATVRRSFEDPRGFARINGQPALALEVRKRAGANVIDTIDALRALTTELQADWPETLEITYLQDQSDQVKSFLSDLEANVIAAVILVMIVVIFALGVRSGILVGLAIPGAFLVGVTALWLFGNTMNIVVLFALILVVGMLVDGAIVTVELADRRLQEGASPKEAYREAAQRMAWPIIASTATTLSVFFPLVFWTGTVGEFMKFLPITVILTLFASLFMALIFIPVIGGAFGRKQPQSQRSKETLHAAEYGDPRHIKGFTGAYVRLLQWAILRPLATFLFAVATLIGCFVYYGEYGHGLSFFPDQEPELMQIQVRARDNFSIWERDTLVRKVEEKLLGQDELASVYARSTLDSTRGDEEIIGTLQLELIDWDKRRPASVIGEEIRKTLSDIAGIEIQVLTDNGGPNSGKPVNFQVRTKLPEHQNLAVETARELMHHIGGFTDVTDTRPLPGVELSIDVNRVEAARFGADVSLLGQAVQMLTQGITVADYRPDDSDSPIDIRVRFPREERSLDRLAALHVPTASGQAPISNFVSFATTPRVGTIRHLNEQRVVTIEANVALGLLVNDQISALREALAGATFPDGTTYEFSGEAEDQAEAMTFLVSAFMSALFLMVLILVLQFNSFSQAAIVMSAVVFSIAGILLGLIITGRPFGVVMGGIGMIALAGIVVNNNIVLIDTFNDLKRKGMSPLEAVLRTGAQRLRPVILTSVTTALGLMPMVLGMNLDFVNRTIVFGAPSTQWWIELSTAIAGGLVFATILTLVVTPAMLMLGVRQTEWDKSEGKQSLR